MDTHEQALQFLEADATMSDDFIQALYTSKVSHMFDAALASTFTAAYS